MSTWIIKMKSTIQLVPGIIRRHRFAKFALLLGLSFASYMFFSRLVVTAVEVRGSSMSPTLVSGDMLIMNRFATIAHAPQRGELVVLKDPETGDLVVKRIIALPEETVQMSLDHVYVNGKALSEPFLNSGKKARAGAPGPATVVPKGHFYVLGDNRNNSTDSRSFGPVPRENIVGVINL